MKLSTPRFVNATHMLIYFHLAHAQMQPLAKRNKEFSYSIISTRKRNIKEQNWIRLMVTGNQDNKQHINSVEMTIFLCIQNKRLELCSLMSTILCKSIVWLYSINLHKINALRRDRICYSKEYRGRRCWKPK